MPSFSVEIMVEPYRRRHDVGRPPSQKRFMGQLCETFFELVASQLCLPLEVLRAELASVHDHVRVD